MAEMRFPALTEIVPGKLVAKVYLHEQATNNGPAKCWTYATEGLWALRQKEVVMTLKLAPGEAPGACPHVPFQFFKLVYDYAAKGAFVDVGGYTDFGADGFLGRRALGYIEAEPFEDFVSLSPSLAAILLTEEEFAVYQSIGLSRVQALLGKSHSYFPCPHWSDLQRASVVTKDATEKSRLAHWAKIHVERATTWLEGNEIGLCLPFSARYSLSKNLKPLRDEVLFALILDIDNAADGCLVWVPGKVATNAIGAPGVKPSRLAGCHLTIASGQPKDTWRFLEDGFFLSLTLQSWKALRQALEAGQPLSLPIGNEQFQLRWTPLPIVELRGAWLISKSDNLKSRVGGVALSDFARAVEAAVVQCCGAAGLDKTKQDIRMQVMLVPGREAASLRAKSFPGIPEALSREIGVKVGALQAPKVTGEPVVIELLFGIWGGTGSLNILQDD